jgi:AraC-like DNA-binding protein
MVDTKSRNLDERLARIAEEFSSVQAALEHSVATNAALRESMSQLCRTIRESVGRSRRQLHQITARKEARQRRNDPSPEGAPDRNSGGLPPIRLRRVLAYIDASLAEPLDVAALAAVAGMSSSHFAAMFKQATGLPPYEAVMRRRIGRAQQLLAEGSLTVAAIASQLGFSSQAHFTTVFRRRVGMPPKLWRAAQRTAIDAAHNQSWYSLISKDAESRPAECESQWHPLRALMEAVTEPPHHADTGASHPGTA